MDILGIERCNCNALKTHDILYACLFSKFIRDL